MISGNLSPKEFPLELLNSVLNHCQPKELFCVALANIDYQAEAERVLYQSIVLNSWEPRAELKTASCLSTLVHVPSKATMVKSFELVYIGLKSFPHADIDRLRESLLGMKSLKHLKFNFPSTRGPEDTMFLLLPTLRCVIQSKPIQGKCNFSLTTLYIPPPLLSDWVLNQKQLKVLEFHDSTWGTGVALQDRQFSICKQLAAQSPSQLTIFLVAAFGWLIDRIVVFPAFSTHTGWNAKDVADAIVWSKASAIDYFRLVVGSLSDGSFVQAVLTSLSEHFRYASSIHFLITNPQIHLNRALFSSLLQEFSYLESIQFEHYGGLDALTPGPYQDDCLGLASSWSMNCPKLRMINFPDGKRVRRNEAGIWV